MGAAFPVLDFFFKEAQVKGCVLTLASQLHGQGMVWQRAHTQAVDWKGAERGNNSDLAMTEGSDFPSSSAQANEASRRHSASTSGPDAQGALAPACLPVHFFILRGCTGG